MEWQGEKLKAMAKENQINLVKLYQITGVTRQIVTSWINGQIPKGTNYALQAVPNIT